MVGMIKPAKLAETRTKIKLTERYAHNLRLILLLGSIVMENRSLRFHQILSDFKFIIKDEDEYYKEPGEILDRVYEARRELKNKKRKPDEQWE